MPKGIETTVDGGTAIVRVLYRDLVAKTVAELLKHADDPADVQAITGSVGRKFRVPTRVVEAAGYVDTGTPDAPVVPRRNGTRAAWAEFLTAQGIPFPADPEAEGGSRDDLRDLWETHKTTTEA